MNTRTNPQLLAHLPLVPLVLRPTGRSKKPLGQILTELGELSAGDMIKAVAISAREEACYGDILLANGMVSPTGLFRGVALQFGCELADFDAIPPDARLIDEIGPQRCLCDGFIPWKRVGGATVIATCRPENFETICSNLPDSLGHVRLAVAPECEIQAALLRMRQLALVKGAETRVPTGESCRVWHSGAMSRILISAALILLSGLMFAPQNTFLILCGWAVFALILNTCLKMAATIATLRAKKLRVPFFMSCRKNRPMMQLPIVSVMVPLFKEKAIAGKLVKRLARLT